MTQREFVDTNILLYAYDRGDAVRQRQAFDLVSRLGRERRGVISIQVMQEFYVNVTRKIATPLTPDAARQRLARYLRWQVYAPLPQDVLSAADLAQRAQLSFWDAMIITSAARSGAATLWSEDLNVGQQIDGVTVRSPFATPLDP